MCVLLALSLIMVSSSTVFALFALVVSSTTEESVAALLERSTRTTVASVSARTMNFLTRMETATPAAATKSSLTVAVCVLLATDSTLAVFVNLAVPKESLSSKVPALPALLTLSILRASTAVTAPTASIRIASELARNLIFPLLSVVKDSTSTRIQAVCLALLPASHASLPLSAPPVPLLGSLLMLLVSVDPSAVTASLLEMNNVILDQLLPEVACPAK